MLRLRSERRLTDSQTQHGRRHRPLSVPVSSSQLSPLSLRHSRMLSLHQLSTSTPTSAVPATRAGEQTVHGPARLHQPICCLASGHSVHSRAVHPRRPAGLLHSSASICAHPDADDRSAEHRHSTGTAASQTSQSALSLRHGSVQRTHSCSLLQSGCLLQSAVSARCQLPAHHSAAVPHACSPSL